MLDQERQFYAENLASWLTQYSGRFALVKARQLIGVYDTDEAAIAEGARLFGLESFLVRRVQEQQETVDIPAITLGLLSANNKRSV